MIGAKEQKLEFFPTTGHSGTLAYLGDSLKFSALQLDFETVAL